MPSFLTPLHEQNDCHTPSGPGGGQFCSGADRAGFETVMADASRRGAASKDVLQLHGTHGNFGVKVRGHKTLVRVTRKGDDYYLPDGTGPYTMQQARAAAVTRIRKAHA